MTAARFLNAPAVEMVTEPQIVYDWPEADDEYYAGEYCGVSVLFSDGTEVARIEGPGARAIGQRLETRR